MTHRVFLVKPLSAPALSTEAELLLQRVGCQEFNVHR